MTEKLKNLEVCQTEPGKSSAVLPVKKWEIFGFFTSASD